MAREGRLLAEARRRGVAVDGAAGEKYRAAVDQLASLYGAGGGWSGALARAGLTESDVRSWAWRQAALEALYRSAGGYAPVTDADARAFYRRHPGRFTLPPTAHVRALEVGDRAAALEALGALGAGRSWAAVARLGRAQDLGYVAADGAGMPADPALETAIRSALDRGDRVFGPVAVRAGWVVGLAEDVRPARELPFEEVAADIRSYLDAERRRAAFRGLAGAAADPRPLGALPGP
jgi:hypothetical protein